jgi:hypothetical protein
MSIFKVTPNDVESLSVVTNPYRQFVSSSTNGIVGTVNVFPRRSVCEKQTDIPSSFADVPHNDDDVESSLRSIQNLARYARFSGSLSAFNAGVAAKLPAMLESYLTQVNSLGQSTRKQKTIDITRSTPTTVFSDESVKKLIIKDQLSAYHRVAYPSAHWAYTNYNCLSFFTSSMFPTSSCLLFPNAPGGQVHEGYVSGTYALSGAFSFDFYVNPRYRSNLDGGAFKAGTIFHLSSTYAVSLVSGSGRDENGRTRAYRIQLQLSHSADIPPSILKANQSNAATFVSGGLSTVTSSGFPSSDLVFLSDDNSLTFNHWHHVIVRWGTNLVNDGTGSFIIDGVPKGTFVIPSSTISPRTFTGLRREPSVLVIGNYYAGLNTRDDTSQANFFAADPALRDGLTQLTSSVSIDEPIATGYAFDHPLNADVHDLAIKRYYMSDQDIVASASAGPKSIDTGWTAFYLPPFFVETSPFRQYVGDSGGILQTPFFEIDGTTNDPFNVALAFGVNGHYINVENFLKDFGSNVFPRVHHMTGVALVNTTALREANEFLYDQPFVRRRNTLLLPCDDGLFVPGFELLSSESQKRSAVDDMNNEELSFINVDDLLSETSLLFANDFGGSTTLSDESIGWTPERPGLVAGRAMLQYESDVNEAVLSGSYDPGIQEGAPLTIYQRTRDASSNQVTFFNVSNLYYGKRILPGSVVLIDPALSGSGGLQITLKDDSNGTLYRADCLTSASTWNAVGTVFYDEGVIAIKSPHLYFFGKEGFDISFRGENNVHVMTIDALAPANQMNSSSNPNFKKVPPSPYANDPEKEFVYVSGINFHDNNMNVVMKTQLAQPIIKRHGDRILFRIRTDF